MSGLNGKVAFILVCFMCFLSPCTIQSVFVDEINHDFLYKSIQYFIKIKLSLCMMHIVTEPKFTVIQQITHLLESSL